MVRITECHVVSEQHRATGRPATVLAILLMEFWSRRGQLYESKSPIVLGALRGTNPMRSSYTMGVKDHCLGLRRLRSPAGVL